MKDEKLWLFYGALSNVEYSLVVAHAQTGLLRQFRNRIGRVACSGRHIAS